RRRGQAVQDDRERDGAHLAHAAGGRVAVPPVARSGAGPRCSPWSRVRQSRSRKAPRRGGRRLISITHLLTGPQKSVQGRAKSSGWVSAGGEAAGTVTRSSPLTRMRLTAP